MSFIAAVSVDVLTVRVAFLAVLALVSLLLTGWRKPARVGSTSPRDLIDPPDTDPPGRPRSIVSVEHLDTELHRRPGPVRRLAAAVGAGGIALVIGTVLAIVVSYAVAFAVIRLTDLLRA